MTDLQKDVNVATGWVKTHTLIAACLASFILGWASRFIHPFH